MEEKNLRKWHRGPGIILALLVVLQAGTGLIFTVDEAVKAPKATAQDRENNNEEVHGHNGNGLAQDEEYNNERQEDHDHGGGVMAILATIHHQGGVTGLIYRTLTGLGLLWMAGSGSLIYFRIKARQKRH